MNNTDDNKMINERPVETFFCPISEDEVVSLKRSALLKCIENFIKAFFESRSR